MWNEFFWVQSLGGYAKSHRESAITATLRDLAVFGKKKKRDNPGRMKKINTDCDPRV